MVTISKISARILVVDDVQDSAASFAAMLEMYGAETRTANDGLEALAKAESFAPDVVLMDVSMPRLNGYEAARRIRKAPWGQSMKLVAITGWGHEADIREAYAAGFDGHLLKPVEPDALIGLIQNLRGALPG